MKPFTIDVAPEFDIVVPSLPGYGYSDLPDTGPVTPQSIAAVWAALMTDVLGYERFGTYGEDVGAGVSDWLAAMYAERVVGVHATHPAYPRKDQRTDLTGPEQDFLSWLAARWDGEDAYSQIQATRPDTVAAGLLDSPSGLAAWIVEKFRAWSDCGGDVGRRFSMDDLLTTVTLYWATGTIGTSFRPYHDDEFTPPLPPVTVPAGISVGRADLHMPQSLAARSYTDIRFYNDLPVGGHFVAREEPELVAADLREFFRPLRTL